MTSPSLSMRAVVGLHLKEHRGAVGARTHQITTLLGLAFVIAGGARLFTLTSSWGDLPDSRIAIRLWLVLIATWLSISVLAALHTLQTALQRQEIGLFLPLPLDHAMRWRMVIGRTASSFGLTAMLGVIVTAAIVGQYGLAWAVVLIAWLPASLCLGVLAPLVLSWLAGSGKRRWQATLVTLGLPVTIILLLVLASQSGQAQTMSPMLMLPDAVLIPTLVLGPGARRLGRWYVTLAQERSHAPISAPGYLGPLSRIIGHLLSRPRSPWAAIALKDLRAQTRDPFILTRIAITIVAVPLFILIQAKMAQYDFDTPALIASFALILGIYTAIEVTPSPFGGEGNRLSLTLLSGAPTRHLIAGKALTVITPLLLQMALMLAALGWWTRVDLVPLLPAGLSATLAAILIGIILTALSARDIDLNQPVEGTAQAILIEHVPNRPIRLVIIGISTGLALGASFTILSLPSVANLAIITTGGVLLGAIAIRDAIRRLHALTTLA